MTRFGFIISILFCSTISLGTVNDLNLSDQGFRVKDMTLHQGGMTLKLLEGEAVPIIYHGVTTGFLFSGRAKMLQSVTETFARQVLDYNLEHASHHNANREGTIEDDIQTAAVLGFEAIKKIPEKLEVVNDFGSAFEIMDDLYFSQDFSQPIAWVLAGVLGETEELVFQMEGSKDDYLYEYDPIWGGVERLSVLENSSIKRKGLSNIYWLNPVVEQTLREDRRVNPDIPALLTSMQYDLDFTDLENMKAEFNEIISFKRQAVKFLRLELWNTTLESKGAGFVVNHLYVDRIVDGQGNPLDYIHDGDYLTITLSKATLEGQTLKISISCHGDLFEPSAAIGSYVRLSGIGWFPSLSNGHYGVNTLFSGSIKTKLPLRAYASVDHWTSTEKDGIYIFQGAGTYPCIFHSVVVGKYYPHTVTVNGTKVTIASLIFENKRAYDLLENLTQSSMDVYNYYLKEFPFESLLIVEAKGLGWGQAPPGMIFASGEIFNSLKDEDTQLYSEGANERFSHEMAHQYFGHSVHSASYEDSWLIEALAEYMAGVFLSKTRQKNDLRQMYNHWYARSKDATEKASIYGLFLLTGENAGTYQHALIYAKGPVVIQALKEELGFKTFWTVLRSFLKSFQHQKVTTEDFIGLINYITKKDWHPFFEKYIYGLDLPKKSKDF
ncbi:MAG TPA: M1 family aminopeptidase [Thermoanaerobaculia bacterium]|nr:M1 family aminopeptidase [Thermoanaerobaculia bacterium]HUM29939.1 M1 family aminopeptidase [Thermoanaerobaculia bacterium]HXK68194.1 M1 family aminopeptidase [Thermoanaerobaculia bacterium]